MSTFLTSGSNFFHSLIVNGKESFWKNSIQHYKGFEQLGLLCDLWSGGSIL